MKKILCYFWILLLTLTGLNTISCQKLNTNVKEIDNNIASLLFKNTRLALNNPTAIIENNYSILYWQNFSNNINNFIYQVYNPNTKIIKPEYQKFFKNLGYKNITTTPNILKYLQITPDSNVGIGKIGFLFSGFSLKQDKKNLNIKISIHNIRIYFEFYDPIYGIYKEFYFSDPDNKYNFKDASIYFPTPKNNMNNVPLPIFFDKNGIQKYLNSKLQLLYLKLWFDWKSNPGYIQNYIVAGTPLSSIINPKNGISVYKNNLFNLLSQTLFGSSGISDVKINRNNKILTNKNTILEKNDILILDFFSKFLGNSLNYQIQIKILR